jgi:hypothetical protein
MDQNHFARYQTLVAGKIYVLVTSCESSRIYFHSIDRASSTENIIIDLSIIHDLLVTLGKDSGSHQCHMSE